MAWNEAVITNDGLKLLADCLTGGSIEITSAVGGESCSPAVSLMAVKEIALPNHNLQVAKIENIKNGVTVNVRVQNNGLLNAYTLRQIGIFAKMKDSDVPVLLALIQDQKGEEIPDEEKNPEFLLEYDFVIPVENGENISVTVTPNTFALEEDLSGHIKDNVRHITAAERTKWNGKSTAAFSRTLGSGTKIGTITIDGTATDLYCQTNTDTTYGNMGAATASAAGKAGLVPAPAAGKHLSFLRGDGTWAVPTNTTYALVTQSANGLMTAADKKKLDGIAASANNYTHPAAAGNKHIPAGGASGQILRWSSDGTAEWGADNNTTYSAATQSANGLMTAADKKKLDGIAEGANAYTHTAYTARTGVPAANQTPAFGGTFSVTQPVSDASGHITAMTSRTVKIPSTAATQSAAGLMSAEDKKKIDNVLSESGAKALVTMGNAVVPRYTNPSGTTIVKGAASVTVSHKVSVLICQVYNTQYADVLVIGSGNTSNRMPFTDITVTLSNSASSAAISFSSGSNLDSTVYYYALG